MKYIDSSKLNCDIKKDFDKLIQYFLTSYNVHSIKIIVNRSWPFESLFEKFNFKLNSITEPNCYSIVNNKRIQSIENDNNNKIYDSGNLEYLFLNIQTD